ncbi:hypothetical protein [Edaphobacter flagellatus]|uniref:hypothetical protein n=1 Tax=Edaphobacter flagellatus TaxID=1933044 RepID=UPI0021B48C26|nr:hypothetical protein [Edaphobacter flagellatus]
MRSLPSSLAAISLLSLFASTSVSAQTPAPPPPAQARVYPGVQTYIPGIFVTPVPNAPFTAKVDIISHELLPDGTVNIRTTINHIARSSSGRIYNERRQLVPASFKGEPRILETHIYDPNDRSNIFCNPYTHIAREATLRQPPQAPPNAVPRPALANPYLKEEQIGTQPLAGLTLTGIRRTRTIPAQVSTTGKDVIITDEYWYSPDLSIYMIIKHNDPRTGEQIVAVSEVDRHEPSASLLAVPQGYKIVDENPPEATQ